MSRLENHEQTQTRSYTTRGHRTFFRIRRFDHPLRPGARHSAPAAMANTCCCHTKWTHNAWQHSSQQCLPQRCHSTCLGTFHRLPLVISLKLLFFMNGYTSASTGIHNRFAWFSPNSASKRRKVPIRLNNMQRRAWFLHLFKGPFSAGHPWRKFCICRVL